MTMRGDEHGFAGTTATPTAPSPRSELAEVDPVIEHDRLDTILRQFEAFGRIAHIGGFEWDIRTDTVTWTDELYRIYGQEPQSFGATFEAFLAQIHPDDVGAVQANIADAIERCGEFVMHERIFRPDGELVYLDTWGEVVTGPDGEPARLVGVCEDVTGLRMQEAALTASREDLLKYKALVDASNDLIGIADLDGCVLYVNPAGRRLIGILEDLDVTTTTIGDYLDEDGKKRSLEVEQKAVLSEGKFEGESWLIDKDTGDRIPVSVSSFLMHHPDTGLPMAQGTVQRDLRDQKAAEARLAKFDAERQQLLAHIVEAQEAERRRIAGDVHDDTIQVMAAADLRLGLLARSLKDEGSPHLEQIEKVRTSVREATVRLRSLISVFEDVAYDQRLALTLNECATRLLTDSGITWTVDGDRDVDLPAVARVVAYRICHEAIANARNHSGGTTVAIHVTAVDDGVEVTITDNGVGVDPDITSPAGHFGLTSMRERAAIAGGWWRIERAEPKGAVVRFWLPASAENDPPAA
jgi:PAS domain S-box-containing protein